MIGWFNLIELWRHWAQTPLYCEPFSLWHCRESMVTASHIWKQSIPFFWDSQTARECWLSNRFVPQCFTTAYYSQWRRRRHGSASFKAMISRPVKVAQTCCCEIPPTWSSLVNVQETLLQSTMGNRSCKGRWAKITQSKNPRIKTLKEEQQIWKNINRNIQHDCRSCTFRMLKASESAPIWKCQTPVHQNF